MATRLEKQAGWLLAIAAIIWAAYLLASIHGFPGGYLRLGPMQLLMAGVLLWLHGKFRTSKSVRGDIGTSGHLKKTA